jgi:hypothetical protein
VNYRASIVLGALLAVGITGCDPYEDEKGGAPAVVGVTLTEGGSPVVGTAAGSAWSVTADDHEQYVVFIHTNKLLDPATIQTSVSDCTPAGGWLQVTGPALACTEGGTPAWYSCYAPSSPTPDEGASIVLFQACEPISGDAGGWLDVGQPLEPSSTYRLTGTVKDRSGADLPIDVTVTTPAAPPPAA